jgi:L-2,4-diaminobutyrate decarboxylase
MNHPRFFGFIPSPISPISWLGEMITTAFNVHAGSWLQSSGPSAVEDALIAWFAEKADLPSSAGGIFLSG